MAITYSAKLENTIIHTNTSYEEKKVRAGSLGNAVHETGGDTQTL